MARDKKGIAVVYLIIAFAVVVVMSLLYINWSEGNLQLPQPKVNISPKQTPQNLDGSTFEARSGGCGNANVYKYSNEGSGVSVFADLTKLDVTSEPKTFNLEGTPTIKVIYAEGEELAFTLPGPFCNDVLYTDVAKPKVWSANSGIVIITNKGKLKKPPNAGVSPFDEYYIDVFLRDVRFLDENGRNEIYLDSLEFIDVLVGWYPG